jgi:hypothetical protein
MGEGDGKFIAPCAAGKRNREDAQLSVKRHSPCSGRPEQGEGKGIWTLPEALHGATGNIAENK